MSSSFINIPGDSWQTPVPSSNSLPTAGNNLGDARVAQDTQVIYIWNGSSWVAASGGGGGSGTVTSVGLSLPVSVFTVTNSPVTTSGTLTGTFASQSANQVFSGPTSGSVATPSFRALVTADIPTTLNSKTLDTTTLTTSAVFGNYHVEPSQSTATISATTATVNLSNASAFILTLASSTTISFVNPQTGGAYALEIVQGASTYAVSWQAGVLWPGGTKPTITTANGAKDKVSLYYDGTNYFGTYAQAFS